ncbi:MAG: hypothetical protein OEW42_00390 [Acidimicrobiia bacterium]|nr:hypothetical protein [Acidimicrobiia bacterium]MDH5236419.1 hypothetical protein [Acidimicrobiia bacterium]
MGLLHRSDDSELSGRCAQHRFLPARGVCPRCGHEYCAECLAYPRGRDHKPMCVGCAAKVLGFHRNGRTRSRLNVFARRRRYKIHAREEAARIDG